MARPKQTMLEPAEDYGFFGPDSVTWKVWSYPTSLTVGFQRAVVVEELDPALVASVDATQAIFERPRTRYDRTLRYFALVAFGDSRTTSAAADVLVKVHSKAVGTEPYGGATYDANDPRSQLWIQLTGWHSILYAYEKYGPGPLTPAEERQYWAECAVAAELQTCDPDDVPRDRAGLRAYYEAMRPQLSASPIARKAMRHLLTADVMLPPLPRALRPASWVVGQVLRAATLATLPRWMREDAGLRQHRLIDALVTPVMRTAFWTVHRSRRLELALLRFLSPSTVPVAGPVLLGIAARNDETLTPAQARERYGYDRPAEAHLELRARQRAKALAGERPGDEVIRESESLLGRAGLA
ncbi:MAG: DUF2236 domain-containing protein [Actinobacteria bacterium]|nr:DUF2236 domain-containing protein [Actinomycetota bacterium]